MLSVDIEAALNAGHCVDPDKEIQVCAIAPGIMAMADNRAALILSRFDRCCRLDAVLVLDPIADPRLYSTDSAIIESALLDGKLVATSWLVSQISSLIFPSANGPRSYIQALPGSTVFAMLMFILVHHWAMS